VPEAIDLAMLPEGLSYDQQTGWLSLIGQANEKTRARLNGLCDDPAWRGAVDELLKQLEKGISPPVVYKATTCDLCESLKQEPNCVYACPHEAAKRVDPRTFFAPGIAENHRDAEARRMEPQMNTDEHR
jgi:Fe-S-cluster-containing hydrogenase component 2